MDIHSGPIGLQWGHCNKELVEVVRPTGAHCKKLESSPLLAIQYNLPNLSNSPGILQMYPWLCWIETPLFPAERIS